MKKVFMIFVICLLLILFVLVILLFSVKVELVYNFVVFVYGISGVLYNFFVIKNYLVF